MPPHEFEPYRALPAWQARLASAHTLPRELRAEEQYQFQAARFKDMAVPTLFLLGGESPSSVKESTATVAAALPHSQIVVMPGQQHIAMDIAPDLFLHEVLTFLTGS
jgi:pimeloyl-ACP methyl ester carboxylesterase